MKWVVKAFCSSKEYQEALVEFVVDSYFEGMANCWAKVHILFPNLNLDHLNGDDKALVAKVDKEAKLAKAKTMLVKVAKIIGAAPLTLFATAPVKEEGAKLTEVKAMSIEITETINIAPLTLVVAALGE